MSVIEKYFDRLYELCQQYRVEKLYVFGSALTDRFDIHTSDIDLIVELQDMPPIEKGETLLILWEKLETLFQRKVDLLTDQPVSNPVLKKQVERSKKLIYDRRSQKVPL
jgi:predicted nucleotidyltransferase